MTNTCINNEHNTWTFAPTVIGYPNNTHINIKCGLFGPKIQQ